MLPAVTSCCSCCGTSAIGDSILETLLLSTAHGAHSSSSNGSSSSSNGSSSSSSSSVFVCVYRFGAFCAQCCLAAFLVGFPCRYFGLWAVGSNQVDDYVLPVLLLLVVFVLICLWWWVRTGCGVCYFVFWYVARVVVVVSIDKSGAKT